MDYDRLTDIDLHVWIMETALHDELMPTLQGEFVNAEPTALKK
ncbi:MULTISPECIES: hypothetical protein [unclassified Leclercia]|nr:MULTISPECIES: hypothetical protein [unclassified Leclercia]